MNSTKLNIFLLINIFLCSCSVKNNIVGKYMSPKNSNCLQIKKDGTFIYEYRYLHLYQHSFGRWEKNRKNLIVLNSEIKDVSIPLVVSRSVNKINENNNMNIKLIIKDGDSLINYKCRIYINDVVYCLKRCDSLSNISIKSPINSLYFMFIKEPLISKTTFIPLQLTSNEFISEIKSKNNFEVKIEFSDVFFYYKPFKDEILKVGVKNLKMFNPHKRKWKKILKVSDSTNIFSRYNNSSSQLNEFR